MGSEFPFNLRQGVDDIEDIERTVILDITGHEWILSGIHVDKNI